MNISNNFKNQKWVNGLSQMSILNEESRRSFIKKFAVASVVLASCKDDTPEKTIANLKEAVIAEANAKAKYVEFADRATKEGYRKVANLFNAVAAAESIHLKNHNAVLKKLGEKEVIIQDVGLPTVNDTIANLEVAIAGETHEFKEMYPGFISTANKEECGAAVESFKWAISAEENHAMQFSLMLEIIKEGGTDEVLPKAWFVCPQCGGLFTQDFSKCLFCKAETDRQFYIPIIFNAEK